MANLKGTKTEENLMTALAGESQARVKYEFMHPKPKRMAMSKSRTFSIIIRQRKGTCKNLVQIAARRKSP